MRLNKVAIRVAIVSGVAALAFATSTPSANAAAKKRVAAAAFERVELSSHSRRHVRRTVRSPTRIIVRRRSYLDPGTTPIPGESKELDYAFPVGHTPMQVVSGPISPAGWQNPNWPLPGPHFPW